MDEQKIEFWEGKVKPERIFINGPKWDRHKLHNAANLLHLQNRLKVSESLPRNYKVAWVGGCVLYDTRKLKRSGGFGFWEHVPEKHSGEDVIAQLNVMAKYGGCGQIPSGVYHQELPTTIPNREFDLPEFVQ